MASQANSILVDNYRVQKLIYLFGPYSPALKPSSPGVLKGGFLLLKLKLTKRLRSQVLQYLRINLGHTWS